MKRALVVGINAYPTAPLHGCVSDAERIHHLLSLNEDGSVNFDARLLTSDNHGLVSRDLLEMQLEQLFMQDADAALFYFSGHGSHNIFGGYLVTQEATRAQQGFAFRDLQTLVLNSKIREITIVLDCCHAGELGNEDLSRNTTVELREGVTIIAACQPTELARETSGGGLFTSLLVDALSGEAADITGKITLAGIYHHIDGLLTAWDQRPLYKAHISQMLPIRTVDPQFRPSELSRITKLFPTIEHEIRLDPAYEKSSESGHTEKERDFAFLQRLRDARLVAVVAPHVHLYTAAMDYGRCRLTPTGRYYWKMIDRHGR